MAQNHEYIGVEMTGDQWMMMDKEASERSIALVLDNGNVFIETTTSWRSTLDRFNIDEVTGKVSKIERS